MQRASGGFADRVLLKSICHARSRLLRLCFVSSVAKFMWRCVSKCIRQDGNGQSTCAAMPATCACAATPGSASLEFGCDKSDFAGAVVQISRQLLLQIAAHGTQDLKVVAKP